MTLKSTIMKRKKLIIAFAISALAIGGLVYAADHIDSPTVTNQSTDITDVYVFRGADQNNLVFVANTQGLLSPASTATASFSDNTLIEFNIDNNNDNVEDLVIQAIYSAGKMKVYSPDKPSETGARSKIEGKPSVEFAVTAYGSSPVIGTSANGIKAFAGPRDDPFFFDLNQFKKVIAGQSSTFSDPGTDTFKGTNVLSLVVEVPKSMLKASGGSINVWLETKKKI